MRQERRVRMLSSLAEELPLPAKQAAQQLTRAMRLHLVLGKARPKTEA